MASIIATSIDLTKIPKDKIINGKKLPKGWTGKVWALKQGIDSISPKFQLAVPMKALHLRLRRCQKYH